jgi:hypothetical protein
MKKKLLFFVLLCSLIVSFFNCKKDDNPVQTTDNSKELFPLVVGNKLEYSEYAIDINGNKIANSDLKIVRTVTSQTTIKGVSAFIVVDESYKGTTLDSKDTTYIHKETNGDVKYLIIINEEMSGVNFFLSDWFTFYKPSEGIEKEYTVYKKDTTMKIPIVGIMFDAVVSINVTGKIFANEQVIVPIQTQALNANRVDINIKISASVAGYPYPIEDGLFFQQWLSEGIGPIKEQQPASSSSDGYKRELTKKYF